jgi:hypothetical protein
MPVLEFFDNLDPADRLLAAGALSLGGLGLAIPGMIALGAVGDITLLAALGTLGTVVAPIALAPALAVTGIYAYTATERQSGELLQAMGQVYDAVKMVNRPVEWLKDALLEHFHAPEGSTLDNELPSTKETTSKERVTEHVKGQVNDATETLLKPSEAEKGTRSRNDPAGTESPSRSGGPMRNDPTDRRHDHSDDSKDDGPQLNLT